MTRVKTRPASSSAAVVFANVGGPRPYVAALNQATGAVIWKTEPLETDETLSCERLDEAAAVCAGEEFELPISPAWALCILIAVCERVGDFPRVAQWCEAMRSIGERLNGLLEGLVR
jgi:hypothetical protein